MLSDAFAKQDHTCFQGQRGDRLIQSFRTRKTICGYVPIDDLYTLCTRNPARVVGLPLS
jgi:hypothetical protein